MIPITFNKDDLNNEKKGTIRAQDLASLVGLVYPKKVGVLDIFDNPVSVTNVDLSTTGYVKLTFSKGYVCAYGRLIYVEQSELVTLQLPSTTESGNIIIRVNLAESGANEVEWDKSASTLQTDNLLNNPANGVCEIPIYAYSANNTSFNLGAKVAQTIPSITDYLAGANFTTQAVSDTSTKLATTEFVKNLFNSNFANISKTQTGYAQLPNGLMFKWGMERTQSGLNGGTVIMDNNGPAFQECFVLLATPFNSSTTDAWVQVIGYTARMFTYKVDRDRTDICYLAIGKVA